MHGAVGTTERVEAGLRVLLEACGAEDRLAILESTLAAAIIEADRGNFEIARKLASDFFTGLQADMSRAPQEHQQELTAIAGQRDVIITAASRSDPQTGSLLAQLYSTYRVTFGDTPVTPTAGPGPAPAPTSTTGAPTTPSGSPTTATTAWPHRCGRRTWAAR